MNTSDTRKARAMLTLSRVLVYLVLIFLSILCLFAFYMLIINSTRSNADLQGGFRLLMQGNFLENLKNAWNDASINIPRGMDANTLQNTVDTYNGYVDAGVDAAFGRPADYLKMKIGSGPYYLIEQKPRFATTMGGLVVNTSLQVMNQGGSPIGGLYAAGEVVGGVMGDDSPSGANNGWALTSGKLAAEAIAAAN